MDVAASSSLPTLLPHPAAEYFPLLQGRAFEELRASIGSVGLLMPITLCDGQILDGRNRYRACIELGIEPRFQIFTGESPVAGAWALNGERRHLSPSQRAAIAVKMLGPLKEEAKKRQQATQLAGRDGDGNAVRSSVPPELGEPNSGEATYQAARIVGVGKTTVQYAKAVSDASPELFEQVAAGKMSADKAYQIVKGRHVEAPPNAPKQPREKRIAQISQLAGEGHRIEQIAEQLGIGEQQVRDIAFAAGIRLPNAAIGKSRRINAHRVVEETVSALEGLALGLQTLESMSGISADEAREWAPSVTRSLRALTALRNKLMEIARG